MYLFKCKNKHFSWFYKKKNDKICELRKNCLSLHKQKKKNGGLAQLARALAWHARGHRFDSDILHQA